MSDVSQGPGWWLASDGKWCSPERRSDYILATPAATTTNCSSDTYGHE